MQPNTKFKFGKFCIYLLLTKKTQKQYEDGQHAILHFCEYTKILSIKTITKESRKGLNTLLTKLMKAAGALVNPNEQTKKS